MFYPEGVFSGRTRNDDHGKGIAVAYLETASRPEGTETSGMGHASNVSGSRALLSIAGRPKV